MKQKNWIIVSILFIILLGGGIFFFISNNNSGSDTTNSYDANKTSTTSEQEQEKEQQKEENAISDNNGDSSNETEESQANTDSKQEPQPIEEQLATFSTKIYSTDSSRQNNINITCNTLNGTIVKKDATFSFTSTVGQASSSKGYEKADVFDSNGNKTKALGGGNCQLSTTLYNAVLAVPSLVVTERHEHSNNVPYAQKGKDAAVAYGSYDLKFKNNSETDIKILCSTDGASVTVSLNSIK